MSLKSKNKSRNVIMALKAITKDPALFLTPQPEKRTPILDLLQNVYKLAYTSHDNMISNEILPELVLKDMDEEQIWQQLELRNTKVMVNDIETIATLLAIPEEKLEIRLKEDKENYIKMDSADEETDITTDLEEENEIDEMQDESTKTKYKKKTVVDDQFFNLEEMEKFVQVEENKEMRKQSGKHLLSDDDGIDYFDENLGEDLIESEKRDYQYGDFSNANPNYKDFFGTKDEDNSKIPQNTQGRNQIESFKNFESDSADEDTNKNSFNHKDQIESTSQKMILDSDTELSSNEEDSEEKSKSEFQKRQERLELRIREYEAEVLGEKPWQMKGEVNAGSRPKNSLLEEILEFESTVRPAPVITEETTRCLEDIIRQRIKDEAWDDVVRVVKPTLAPQDFRKKLLLDQSKSKESLANIYEKEFQRELHKLNPEGTGGPEDEIPKEHIEIRNMMHALFIKLDALSNFHYTPKPVAPEAKIVTNTPAVSMEEVAPVGFSDYKLLAPEEVYRGPKYELMGKSERTSTDKKRALRKKKHKQRAIHKTLNNKDKLQQKLGVRLEKKQANQKLLQQVTRHRNVEKVVAGTDHMALKSSKAFFTKLQDNHAQENLRGTTKSNKNKLVTKDFAAKKIKL